MKSLDGYMPMYDDEGLQNILDSSRGPESTLYEDKMIKSEDWNNGDNFQGACLNWELRGNGYNLERENVAKNYYDKDSSKMTDEELLADCYRELGLSKKIDLKNKVCIHKYNIK